MPSRPSRKKGSKTHRAPPPRALRPAVKKPAAKASARRPTPKAKPSKPKAEPVVAEVETIPRSGDSRRHVLSLSFVRDGDEFMARLETDAGQITELKNRFLDQLLTLVANELEDILE
jgi:hypothetical protein